MTHGTVAGPTSSPSTHDVGDPTRWRMLALLSASVLLSLSAWMTATAVSPELQARWSLSEAEVGLLTTVVQLGFVIGTALGAVLNLGDVIPSRRYFAVSAFAAALANATLLIVPGYGSALGARFLTGAFLAGAYPPAMKMAATWFRSGRGLAIGVLVGALTVGKASPYLLKALGGASASTVITWSSIGGVLAALAVGAAYRDGPFAFPGRPFEWSRVGRIVRDRETVLATGGYLGHMWELYAMWTWVPVFLAASATARGGVSAAWVDFAAFGAIAAGGLGCVWGGVAADRIGRPRVVNLAMTVSGACCLVAGLLFDAPFAWLTALTWVWGFFVVADSAQFSALITEVAPPDSVGTALMLQTSLGFLLTMATIQAVPLMVDWVGWQWAFAFLALGPTAGIGSIRRLQAVQSRMTGGR